MSNQNMFDFCEAYFINMFFEEGTINNNVPMDLVRRLNSICPNKFKTLNRWSFFAFFLYASLLGDDDEFVFFWKPKQEYQNQEDQLLNVVKILFSLPQDSPDQDHSLVCWFMDLFFISPPSEELLDLTYRYEATVLINQYNIDLVHAGPTLLEWQHFHQNDDAWEFEYQAFVTN